ncbi:class I SAM-dependent methyltransferase [Hymenobacter sp. YC55]|uniref:class I SAM-dependent methyltransferase n=1 Tax=Hymenobacter sp. YC55 TaxID=3034019 RepID=UPI0023F61F40|nr:class I SAM-dependent methyltransferase [Hymenobacter sp. YC55]MDF7813195.1 class I SAM-dependent methyltransferase [Hymenobacter sp. YC55]
MKSLFTISLVLSVLSAGYAQQAASTAKPGANQKEAKEMERQKWNAVLTGKETRVSFSTNPNKLLAETIRGLRPGKALDVGMGQGRNTLFLARQGWDAYGVDIADEAVNLAQDNARKANLRITTFIQDDSEFDFGSNRWDLVAFIYAGGRHHVDKVYQSLKPGGLVVIEGFHRDATKQRKIGENVVFDTDELKKLYTAAGFTIVRYEEKVGVGDFGLQQMRLVKLVAQKKK